MHAFPKSAIHKSYIYMHGYPILVFADLQQLHRSVSFFWWTVSLLMEGYNIGWKISFAAAEETCPHFIWWPSFGFRCPNKFLLISLKLQKDNGAKIIPFQICAKNVGGTKRAFCKNKACTGEKDSDEPSVNSVKRVFRYQVQNAWNPFLVRTSHSLLYNCGKGNSDATKIEVKTEIQIRRENCSTRWDWEQQQDQSEGVSSSSYTSSPNVSSGSYGSSAQNASSSYGSSSDCQSAATTAQLAGDLCRWGGYNVMMWVI